MKIKKVKKQLKIKHKIEDKKISNKK